MTIYATPFNPETREPTGYSTDSGFSTLDQVVAAMGPPLERTEALVVYPGAVLFSRLPFWLGVCHVG